MTRPGGTLETKVNRPAEPGPNATGLFRREFSIPSEWKNGIQDSRIFLIFEGVDACLDVWLDGQHVGYSQDSCLQCEFDITTILNNMESQNPGNTDTSHTIALRVCRWCDGSYLEDQDKWWISGVYREVYIMRKPDVMIADYEIKSTISWNENDEPTLAIVDVEVIVENFKLQVMVEMLTCRWIRTWHPLRVTPSVLKCIKEMRTMQVRVLFFLLVLHQRGVDCFRDNSRPMKRCRILWRS